MTRRPGARPATLRAQEQSASKSQWPTLAQPGRGGTAPSAGLRAAAVLAERRAADACYTACREETLGMTGGMEVVATLGGMAVVRTRRAFAVRFEGGSLTEDMTKRTAITRMEFVATHRAELAAAEAAARARIDEVLAEHGISRINYRDLQPGDLFAWRPGAPKTVTEAKHFGNGASLIIWTDGHTPPWEALTLMVPGFPAAYGQVAAAAGSTGGRSRKDAAMISVADLIDLETSPQVAYDGYDELRGEARRRTAGPVNPADLGVYADIMRAHGTDWCRSVLGRDIPPNALGRGGLPAIEAEMLRVAHERNLDPPKPPWLVQWQEESAGIQRRRDEAHEAAQRQDAGRWAAALATCGIPADQLEIRPNIRSRQVRHGIRQELLHVVPLVDVRSERRRHPAGRELCAVGHARVLGESVGQPATCKACVEYTAKIRPATDDPIDPYVRESHAALAALDTADSAVEAVDQRIAAALARRGLVFEQPARSWHLTGDGRRALAALDAEQAARSAGRDPTGPRP